MPTLKINHPDGSDQTYEVRSIDISQQRDITAVYMPGGLSPIDLIPGNTTFSITATIDTSFWEGQTNHAPEIPARTRYDIIRDQA